MSRPVFADPKTDFVFQRIFGSEDHKPALLGFLNDLLELDDAHHIQSVSLLPPEQRPKVSELKYSIVDVTCVDVRGTTYGAREPRSLVEKWAYFFREAENLPAIPETLAHPPVLEALEAARTARFTTAEWDAYIAAGMVIQNERGALSLARQEGEENGRERGREDGRKEGRIATLRSLLVFKFQALDATYEARLRAAPSEQIDRYLQRLLSADSLAAVFED